MSGDILTAGVARAFIDQTLAAVQDRAEIAPDLAARIAERHTVTARWLTSLRNKARHGSHKSSPAQWQKRLTGFVSGVQRCGDPQVWVYLRHQLLAGTSGTPVPVRAGGDDLSAQPSGPADPGLLPELTDEFTDDWLDLTYWPDPAEGQELPDLLESDDWLTTAGTAGAPSTVSSHPAQDVQVRPEASGGGSGAGGGPGRAVAQPGYDEALEVLRRASFGKKEHQIVRVQLSQLFTRGDPVGWPAWGVRDELLGVFPSVLVLSVLRWPDPNKQDSPELVASRDQVGRRVVGALWRAVEADVANAGDVAGVARQVAVAVTAQAPGDPERYSGVDRTLTAGVARAFIDQTLAAVKEAAGREAAGQEAPVVKSVKSLHQKTAGTMVSFRQSGSRDGPKRVSWRTLLSDFVTAVEAAADPRVWWHLRRRLLGDVDGLPAPVPRSAGLQDASVGVTRLLPSVEQEGSRARWTLIRELPGAGSELVSARKALKAWLERGAAVPWPGWQERPELGGRFQSVLVLAALRWPDPERHDSPQLVGLRDRLGQQVVGGLWRMVEADTTNTTNTTDTPDAAEIAWQVAVAVTTQAPTVPGDPAHYAGIGAVLTAGVARAFIDQTLAAVQDRAEIAPDLAARIAERHTATATLLASLRNNATRGRRASSPAQWQNALTSFVSRVQEYGDPKVWAYLRPQLLAGSGTPVPVRAGGDDLSAQPSGPADPGLLPELTDEFTDDWLDLTYWPDPAEGQELADLLDMPMEELLAGSPPGPEPSLSPEPEPDQGRPEPDQGRPDLAWLRRLVPDGRPSSTPITVAGESSAGASAPDASPRPDRTDIGDIPPGTAGAGRPKRARTEEHLPDAGGKRVARQRE